MTIEYFVNKTSYNRKTKRTAYRSRSFVDMDKAQMFYSESLHRMRDKAKKNEDYTCKIELITHNKNDWILNKLDRV